jgi:16S rRNA (guanine(966)-N(2))-methyltransferase RsmD
MRVIAGICRGTALRGGHGPQFRPTAQLVRGSIFDTIGALVEGTSVLDLFAGSGAFGIEALSRGAARAVFIEQDRTILRALRTNLERCRLTGRAEVIQGDAMRHLERLIRSAAEFDIVFADPPYASGLPAAVAAAVAGAGRPFCRLLITESDRPVPAPGQGALEAARERKFGQTIITYFEYRPQAGGDTTEGAS